MRGGCECEEGTFGWRGLWSGSSMPSLRTMNENVGIPQYDSRGRSYNKSKHAQKRKKEGENTRRKKDNARKLLSILPHPIRKMFPQRRKKVRPIIIIPILPIRPLRELRQPLLALFQFEGRREMCGVVPLLVGALEGRFGGRGGGGGGCVGGGARGEEGAFC